MHVFKVNPEDEPYDTIHKMVELADMINRDVIGHLEQCTIIVHPGSIPDDVFSEHYGDSQES